MGASAQREWPSQQREGEGVSDEVKEMLPTWNLRQRAAYAQLLRRDYSLFVRYMWNVLEPSTPLVWNWHLNAIAKKLGQLHRGEILKLVICIPPGTAKSLMVSAMLDPWIWLTNPSERTLTSSYDINLATRDNVKARQIVDSEKYKEVLRLLTPEGEEPWEFRSDQNEKRFYVNTRLGHREVVTVNGGATGKRGDKTIVDDPHKLGDIIQAPPARQLELVMEVRNWYKNVFNSRLNDQATGKRVVIMQRVHQEDLAGALIAEGEYDTLILPMEYDPAIADPEDPRTEPGELLFPAKFPQHVVDQFKRDMLPEQYAAQYGQSPIPAEGGLIHKEWCTQRYKWEPDWRENKALPKFVRVALSIDTAVKPKQINDPSVALLWGQAQNNDVYLLAIWVKRLEYAYLEPALKNVIDNLQPHITLIEDAASGAQLVSKYKLWGYKVHPVVPNQDKYVRMSQQTPWFHTNKVWFPTNDCPGIVDYFKELWLFPQVKHDDQVDATSQALAYFDENKVEFKHELVGGGVHVDHRGVVTRLPELPPDVPTYLGFLLPGQAARYQRETEALVLEPKSGFVLGK